MPDTFDTRDTSNRDARPLRILALTDLYWNGSNYVRLTTPLRALEESGSVSYAEMPIPRWRPWPDSAARRRQQDVEQCDLLWVSRPLHHAALAVMREARQRGKPVLVDLDDWLLDVPVGHDSAALLRVRSRQEVARAALRVADAVTVSTPPIAEQCMALRLHTHLLPNAVDCRRFVCHSRAPGPVTVAFCGTGTHRDDMALIGAPLRRLLHRCPGEVQVVSVGCPIPELDGVTGYTHLDYVPTADYPRFLSDLRIDIGLAPLRDSAFNRAKSDLKYLEYSATGAATIASPVAPYQASIRPDRGILVDSNTCAAWEAALTRLVSDRNVRQQLAANAHAWVRQARSIEATASQWYDVFRQYTGKRALTDKQRELVYAERIFANALLRQVSRRLVNTAARGARRGA